MPGPRNSQNNSSLSLLGCSDSKAITDGSHTLRPKETDENCSNEGNEMVTSGQEEGENNEAGVSQKCSGESSKEKVEVFCCSPIPVEEFGIDSTWKKALQNRMDPPPYIPITSNMYLVKKKWGDSDADTGCEKCNFVCSEDCLCRYQNISCLKACRCSDTCMNRPFWKQKRMKVVKTKFCGWGVEAVVPIKKGEFIIEYVGEVITGDMCEERLSDMGCLDGEHFYMCKVEKDLTIDSTYKGNISRFLNHSCDPNCTLEKWEVRETRIGIFAAKSIEEGEPLNLITDLFNLGWMSGANVAPRIVEAFLGLKRRHVSKEEKLADCG